LARTDVVAQLGVRAVRVGRSVKIREELRAVSLEVQMTRDRRYPRLEEITQEISRLETSQRRSVKQRDSKFSERGSENTH
jgi:signal recognition particle subunit SEC65